MNEMRRGSPFTLTEYRSLVRLATQKLPVVNYANYVNHDSFIIWRHDLEYSVSEMDKLARIDAEEGMNSTFFIQLHSEYYHYWNASVVNTIRQWIEWNHQIGLHFDWGFYRDIGQDKKLFDKLESFIYREKQILEDIYQTNIQAFSYHSPNEQILQAQDNYAGMINTYNNEFLNGDIFYISDSNGRWRARNLREVLEDPDISRLQVNIHDTWWSEDRIPQIAKLEKTVKGSALKVIEKYRADAIIVVEDIL